MNKSSALNEQTLLFPVNDWAREMNPRGVKSERSLNDGPDLPNALGDIHIKMDYQFE